MITENRKAQGLPAPEMDTKTIGLEPVHTWLKRIHKNMRKNLPGMKEPKIVNGVTVYVRVNHFKRLLEIFNKDGYEGVQRYADERVIFYNIQLAKHIANKKNPLHAVRK